MKKKGKFIFDIDENDALLGVGKGIAIDKKGHVKVRISENIAVDAETGVPHLTSSWLDDDKNK